jgi:hypothetical protein
MSNTNFLELASHDLSHITGGAGPSNSEFDAVRQQAAQHCPQTAAKYAHVDPSTLTRSKAQQMGNACIAEMGPFMGGMARGRIDAAIDKQFPK